MTIKNTTASLNKNLTIVFSAEKHTQVERMASNEKRSKSQMANILIEEAMQARGQSANNISNSQIASHG
jgi:hypothetical protein